MTKEDGFKVGMVGVGFVGFSALGFAQESFHDELKFHWLLDSQHEVHKSDGSPFTAKEINEIMTIKRRKPRGSLEECSNSVSDIRIENVGDAREKAQRIRETPC